VGRLRPDDWLPIAAHDHEETLPDSRCAKVAGSQLAVINGVSQPVNQPLSLLAVFLDAQELAALDQRRVI
jgi:hypothetical protein